MYNKLYIIELTFVNQSYKKGIISNRKLLCYDEILNLYSEHTACQWVEINYFKKLNLYLK